MAEVVAGIRNRGVDRGVREHLVRDGVVQGFISCCGRGKRMVLGVFRSKIGCRASAKQDTVDRHYAPVKYVGNMGLQLGEVPDNPGARWLAGIGLKSNLKGESKRRACDGCRNKVT